MKKIPCAVKVKVLFSFYVAFEMFRSTHALTKLCDQKYGAFDHQNLGTGAYSLIMCFFLVK